MSGMAGGTTSTQIYYFVNPAECKQSFIVTQCVLIKLHMVGLIKGEEGTLAQKIRSG